VVHAGDDLVGIGGSDDEHGVVAGFDEIAIDGGLE
jgi:hypothetical protein